MDESCPQDVIDLREFFNTKIDNVLTLIEGNDRNYNTQFANAKEAVSAALTAQEKAVAAAFLAAEKAILKAEDAQKDYNQRSNEFRGQLDDQAKTLASRSEVLALFKGVEEKFISGQTANEKVFDRLTEDIKSLRESRSENLGHGLGIKDFWGVVIAILGITIAVIIKFR